MKIYLDMDSKMRTMYSHRLDKRFSLKFPEGYPNWQTVEGIWRTQSLKYCDYNNKDINLIVHNGKKDNSSFHRFRRKRMDDNVKESGL